MSTIYLIRHAQASFGRENYDRLSEAGLRQSEVLAGHFNMLSLEFDAIYLGTQQRHEQTLCAFLQCIRKTGASSIGVHKTEAFNEYDSEIILKNLIPEVIRQEPAFEANVASMMQDKRSFQLVYEKIMRRWVAGDYSIPILETWTTYSCRVRDGLRDLMAAQGAGKMVAVFTSGGPISVCVQQALNLSDETTLQLTWQIMNASVTRLKYSGDRLMLSGFNDVTHLELKQAPSLLTYR